MTHQNRSKRTDAAGRSPSPQEIRDARLRAGLDEVAAARLCYSTASQWTRWELGEMNGGARMHPAIWQYWLSRARGLSPAAWFSPENTRLIQRYLLATGRTELTLDDLPQLLDAARKEGASQ